MKKGRIEAFSDGVLAIIITIMVLEMKTPHEATWHALFEMAPKFISYILSFLMVGIFWGNHHHMFHTIKKINSSIMLSNLGLLFCLSLVPFATGWMGENDMQAVPTSVYAMVMMSCGISYAILQFYIARSLPETSKTKVAVRNQNLKDLISTICYVSAVPLAFVNPRISQILFFVVAAIWIVPDKGIEKSLLEENN
jgi:uncharacterized membrane protein